MNGKSQQTSLNRLKVLIGTIIVLALLWLVIGNFQQDESANNPYTSVIDSGNKEEQAPSSFFMSNNLQCEILQTESDDKGEIINLIDLQTDNPRALFPSGVNSPMKKVSETDNILVIQLVASGSGSTDTITVYKNTGRFEREEKGTFLGEYSYSSSGQCR